MSTIRETALAAVGGRVPRGQGTQAQAAVDALEGREKEMFAEIVEAGVGLGGSRDEIHQLLVDVGMTAPDVDADGGDDCDEAVGGLHARFDALEKKVDDAIARFSRRRR